MNDQTKVVNLGEGKLKKFKERHSDNLLNAMNSVIAEIRQGMIVITMDDDFLRGSSTGIYSTFHNINDSNGEREDDKGIVDLLRCIANLIESDIEKES